MTTARPCSLGQREPLGFLFSIDADLSRFFFRIRRDLVLRINNRDTVPALVAVTATSFRSARQSADKAERVSENLESSLF
ncbi:hypothetical protein ASG42_30240 [Rhizobium sp. Leaf391]|nr:hypothetical protein ASG42_30240 [Rhizobium sp. Leaf391]